VRLDVPVYVEESVMERASIMPDEEVENEIPPASPTPPAPRGAEDRLSIFEDFVESLDLDDLETDDDDDND
jgi:bifunctional DNase/RNase